MAQIIDTFAWIEYFRGSAAGHRIRKNVEAKGNLVPTIVIAELSKKFTDLGRRDLEEKLAFIRSRSILLPLDEKTAVDAGRIRSNIGVDGIGMVDCILLAVARTYGVKVLTGDRHFKDLEDADYFVIS